MENVMNPHIGGKVVEDAASKSALVDALTRPFTPESSPSDMVRWTGTDAEAFATADYAGQTKTLSLTNGEWYRLASDGQVQLVNDNEEAVQQANDYTDTKFKQVVTKHYTIKIVANGASFDESAAQALIDSSFADTKVAGATYEVIVLKGGSWEGSAMQNGGKVLGDYNGSAFTWTVDEDADTGNEQTQTYIEDGQAGHGDKSLTSAAVKGIKDKSDQNADRLQLVESDLDQAELDIVNANEAASKFRKFQENQNKEVAVYQDTETTYDFSPAAAIATSGTDIVIATSGVPDGTHTLRFETPNGSFIATGSVAGGIMTVDNTSGAYDYVAGQTTSRAVEQAQSGDVVDLDSYYTKTESDSRYEAAEVVVTRELKKATDADFDANLHVGYTSADTSLSIQTGLTSVRSVSAQSPSGKIYGLDGYSFNAGEVTLDLFSGFNLTTWKVIVLGK